ncbi:hypothetical protein ACUXPM_003594 [Ralstonia sp. 151470066-2]|jgi:hypothetical protein|nr:hypothetical protein [Ralstonia insidiosa]
MQENCGSFSSITHTFTRDKKMKQLLLIAIAVCAATAQAETATQSAHLEAKAINAIGTPTATTQGGQSINVANAAGAAMAIKQVPIQGSHCDLASGPISAGSISTDANGRMMQCFGSAKGAPGTWQYVVESDSERIEKKLDQLNITNMQILAKLSELAALQQSGAHK